MWDESSVEPSAEIVYGLNPVLPLSEPWQVAMFALVVVGVVVISLAVLWRDARGLPAGLRWLLAALRLLAVISLVLFALEPQQSTRTRQLHRSRLPILVDTSLSMSLNKEGGESSGERRIDAVIAAFRDPQFWSPLLANHDIDVYCFDDQSQGELVASSRAGEEPAAAAVPSAKTAPPSSSNWFASRCAAWLTIVCAGIGVFLLGVAGWSAAWGSGERWWMAGGWLAMTGALAALAVCDLATPDLVWQESFRLAWYRPADEQVAPAARTGEAAAAAGRLAALPWHEILAPRGAATRLGDVLENLVQRERGGPIPGCLVVSDGAVNAGVDLSRAGAAARAAGIPLFLIGVGNPEPPKNFEIVSWQLPAKAFPKDRFFGRAVLRHSGYRGAVVRLQVVSSDDQGREPEVIESELETILEGDGEPQTVDVELQREALGLRRYQLRSAPLPDEIELNDNQRSNLIEIVDRRSVVLLVAGGPHRDFQFLRNQLHRDPTVELHVWLQSAQEGASQEGDHLLGTFPGTLEELDAVDCIVAFDPDWSRLSPEQAAVLEEWLANRAGGLIVTAGPVNTPQWTRLPTRHPVASLVRRIYPVVFYQQSSAVLSLGRFGGERAWPLEFTREGGAAEYLWLADTREENEQIWRQFAGVYGYYAVNAAKPGAEVLAYFSDPKTAVDGRLPIYLASQLYGGGRVLFQASNEIWRLRRLDPVYFQRYFDRVIRWASQGRLNRDAKNGSLVTDRQNYWVGESVWIQASLPAMSKGAASLAALTVDVVLPGGERASVTLQADPAAPRPGTFTGNLFAQRAGDHRLRLPLPQHPKGMLTAQFSVAIPEVEKQDPRRNDQGLQALADQTGGRYWRGLDEVRSGKGAADILATAIPPQDQVTVLPGAPHRSFRRKLMIWLLIFATFVLASEWTCRRLNKLA